jgi:DNA-binding response OmpR family regulator
MKINEILLVEDDLSLIDGLEFSLKKNGFPPSRERQTLRQLAFC